MWDMQIDGSVFPKWSLGKSSLMDRMNHGGVKWKKGSIYTDLLDDFKEEIMADV